jgi:hypothetical protein
MAGRLGEVMAWEVTLLSDTIASGIFLNDGFGEVGESAGSPLGLIGIRAAAEFAGEVIRMASLHPPAFALRGSIAWGDFIMRPECMVGPAVDEAADCAEQAEAAVVWCAPSALHVLEGMPTRAVHPLFVRWPVPLKGGRAYETFAVSPLTRNHDKATRDAFWSALEPSFDRSRLDVEIKRQRTAEFVRHALQTTDTEAAASKT